MHFRDFLKIRFLSKTLFMQALQDMAAGIIFLE
jgi:hypothetical protein